jgi:hypothetical protein
MLFILLDFTLHPALKRVRRMVSALTVVASAIPDGTACTASIVLLTILDWLMAHGKESISAI